MPRARAKCGTEAAYRRHLRNKEPVDEACRLAHAELGRERREKYAEERGKAPGTLAKEAKVQRQEAAEEKNSLSYSKSKHITSLEETLGILKAALLQVSMVAPDKIPAISREIRATEAEIERLTAVEEEKAPQEADIFGAFLSDNIARFPGTKAG